MKNKIIFFRTVVLSSVIIFNIILFLGGIAICYQNICLEGYGEYKSAKQITEDFIQILEYEINNKITK